MKKMITIVGIIVLVAVLILVTKHSVKNEPADKFPNNVLPFYGAKDYGDYMTRRPEWAKTADDKLIATVTEDKKQEEASKDAIKLGWNYLSTGDFNTAMKRFNQAWLLDHENFNVYWGYAAVYGSKNELQNSADYFERAIAAYSAKKEMNKNDYLSLWKDASLTYINLADANLSVDDAKAKVYASKAIDLLTKSMKEKDKLPKGVIPEEMLFLAFAHANNGAYKEARSAFDSLSKEYPDYANSAEAFKFDLELRDKGF